MEQNEMIPILLTASVDTRGMKGAKFTALEREKMYVDTLNYYISDFSKRKGFFTFVFVENSGWDKSLLLKKLNHADNVCVEYVALPPEKFDQTKGKSYNEMLLIDLATEDNPAVLKAGAFFKVTGRFPILNLYKLVNEVLHRVGGGKIELISRL